MYKRDKMDYQQALKAAQAAATHAGDCRVLWVRQAFDVWDKPCLHGYADDDWICCLKGEYPGAVSWIVLL